MSAPKDSGSQPPGSAQAGGFVIGSIVANGILLPVAIVVLLATRSQLVLAQGADSLLDVAVGAILLLSLLWARKPRDQDHPFGHQRAEPLGAIFAAVLAGALAVEVLHSGISALVNQRTAVLSGSVVAFLGAKLVAKLVLLFWIGSSRLTSAAHAARIDARNDAATCASSIVGYLMARSGLAWADAALALPVGLYIGFNGISLARENIRYLMGEAPPDETLDELRRAARDVSGVLDVTGLRAQYLGQVLHVSISILVDGRQPTTDSHDISVRVQQQLETFAEVSEAFVHVDTEGGIEHA